MSKIIRFHETGGVRPWSIRSLTDFRRHAQYCSFPPVNPAKFLPPCMPTTCHFFRRFNDRNVPEAEVNPGILRGSYREAAVHFQSSNCGLVPQQDLVYTI